MPRNLQDLIDQVSAESWDRYLPPPSTVRKGLRRPTPHRSLVIAGATALVVAAVVVPATVANRVGSADRSRPASGQAAATAPCLATGKAPDLTAALLTTADAVPGYKTNEKPRSLPNPTSHLMAVNDPAPGVEVGQQANVFADIQTVADPVGWQVIHQVLRYSPGAAEAGYAAAVRAVRRGNVTVLTDRGGAEPELIFKEAIFEKDSQPKAPNWGIATRSGDCVSMVYLWSMAPATEVSPDGPGLDYLKTLASIVRAKSVGGSAPKLPLPDQGQTSPAPKDYLRPADLGDGTWSVGTMGGNSTRREIAVSTGHCTDGGTLPLRQPSTLQPYQGVVNDQEWIIVEMVLRMSADDARKLFNAERAYEDSACSPTEVVATPSGVGDEMFIVHRTGQNGQPHVNKAWVRIGGTVILLDISADDSSGSSVAIPGVNAYLTTVARKAVTRAQER